MGIPVSSVHLIHYQPNMVSALSNFARQAEKEVLDWLIQSSFLEQDCKKSVIIILFEYYLNLLAKFNTRTACNFMHALLIKNTNEALPFYILQVKNLLINQHLQADLIPYSKITNTYIPSLYLGLIVAHSAQKGNVPEYQIHIVLFIKWE